MSEAFLSLPGACQFTALFRSIFFDTIFRGNLFFYHLTSSYFLKFHHDFHLLAFDSTVHSTFILFGEAARWYVEGLGAERF